MVINRQMLRLMANNKAHNNQQIMKNNKNRQEKDKIDSNKVKANKIKKVIGKIIINKDKKLISKMLGKCNNNRWRTMDLHSLYQVLITKVNKK